ncbi:MAG: DUF445 family protein [Clostridiales bacterium]|nr:DUF445 family protein [Clostridiales bacterium]
MALVGAGIGWFTNYLAVKLIFRPLNPIRIPILGVEIQGLVPKRRNEIAACIGKTVEEQLISREELSKHLNTEKNRGVIIKNIRVGILRVVNEKLPSFIPSGIKNTILNYIGDVIDKESKAFIANNMDKLIKDAVETIDISQLVEQKINDFDLIELESIILSLSKRELKYIELLGGVLGLLIGLFQGIFMKFIT